MDRGWLSDSQFLNGFALAQAMPGPMFTISAYIGAVLGGFGGSLICTFGLFAPGILSVAAFMPFYLKYRKLKWFKLALDGVNAAAIG